MADAFGAIGQGMGALTSLAITGAAVKATKGLIDRTGRRARRLKTKRKLARA